jgi:hypothetical protein
MSKFKKVIHTSNICLEFITFFDIIYINKKALCNQPYLSEDFLHKLFKMIFRNFSIKPVIYALLKLLKISLSL